MGKRIVILNGSPRRAGNTAALTAAFTKGAEEAGHTVTEFFLGELDIHGCRGCFGGSGGLCLRLFLRGLGPGVFFVHGGHICSSCFLPDMDCPSLLAK